MTVALHKNVQQISQFYANGKYRKRNCDAACTEHCKSLMKIPDGHNKRNHCLSDVNILSIHKKTIPADFYIILKYLFDVILMDKKSTSFQANLLMQF